MTDTLKPSVADLAFLGHYSKVLCDCENTLDKLYEGRVYWHPESTGFQICIADGIPEPEKPTIGHTYKLFCKEVFSEKIYEGVDNSREISKASCELILYAVKSAYEEFTRGLSKITFALATRCHGEEYAKDLKAEYDKRVCARWEKELKYNKQKEEEAEAALSPEEKAAKEEARKAEEKKWEESRKKSQLNRLKWMARELKIELDNQDMTIKDAIAALEKAKEDDTNVPE